MTRMTRQSGTTEGVKSAMVVSLINEIQAKLDELNRIVHVRSVVSCHDAAVLLGVTGSTVSRYLRNGVLHKVIRDGRQGILLDDVLKLKKD